ncbi:dihydrolipoyl dehydrogenase [Mycobacterium sp. ACS1612]|uniref:dihydrolipoyl dehydrogenase n=1 Tax=Mycobacterium sp. ACS1612 TaxID=1834117 RepID=UPI0007FBB2EF|nr:dihydrolipoyl dehydrogenase [Mycobacterium sp. ACS1612]OBF26006.1 dihydrolipoyl dehydrogenase [Mycobacterium sp. ACS1612]
MKYDVVVLGAGSGGYVAAIRAAQLGLSVAIVEAQYWGGVCLNVGCIPSKALLRNAEIAHLLRTDAEKFGIEGDTKMRYDAAFDRSRQVAVERVRGLRFLMRKNKIDEFEGKGTFVDRHTMRVTGQDVDTRIGFDSVIIATGATPRLLPGTTRGPRVRTYTEQIMSREVPTSIAIIGAGPIGMEFAYLLANYGVDVTVIEALPRVLPNEDADVSKEIAKAYRNLDVSVLVGTRIEELTETGDAVTLTHRSPGAAEADSLTVDVVLQAIGFAPRTAGYGLENLGVATDPRTGGIVVDDVMRTTASGVYAIGDVTAKLMLAHVAEAQGIIAAETIAGTPTLGLSDYAMMPRVTFCQPQVASFGLTEVQARADAAARGSDIAVAKFPFRANGKAHGYGDATGFAKVIADRAHGELLGAHLVGADVAELLPELTLAQRWDLTVEELVRNVHTHPTLSEALQETFHGLTGKMINF